MKRNLIKLCVIAFTVLPSFYIQTSVEKSGICQIMSKLCLFSIQENIPFNSLHSVRFDHTFKSGVLFINNSCLFAFFGLKAVAFKYIG